MKPITITITDADGTVLDWADLNVEETVETIGIVEINNGDECAESSVDLIIGI
jgi:hypothetical protein